MLQRVRVPLRSEVDSVHVHRPHQFLHRSGAVIEGYQRDCSVLHDEVVFFPSNQRRLEFFHSFHFEEEVKGVDRVVQHATPLKLLKD